MLNLKGGTRRNHFQTQVQSIKFLPHPTSRFHILRDTNLDMSKASIPREGGGKSYADYRKNFDPFDIFGWYIPKRLLKNAPHKSDPIWPTDADIPTRWKLICALVNAAGKANQGLPYDQGEVNEAKELFLAKGGYKVIIYAVTVHHGHNYHRRT